MGQDSIADEWCKETPQTHTDYIARAAALVVAKFLRLKPPGGRPNASSTGGVRPAKTRIDSKAIRYPDLEQT